MLGRLTTRLAAAWLFTIAGTPALADDYGLVLTALVKVRIVEQTLPDASCTFTNTVNGAVGRDLNLGEITLDSTEVVELGPFPDCLTPGGAEFGDVEASFVITTANSDQIFGFWQTVILIGPAGDVTALGRYEITGGSGSFMRAKGKGGITAQGKLGDPAVTGQLIGDIASGDDDD